MTGSVFSARAQKVQSKEHKSLKIGLALSGGGAKGFAHIGVLKVLSQYLADGRMRVPVTSSVSLHSRLLLARSFHRPNLLPIHYRYYMGDALPVHIFSSTSSPSSVLKHSSCRVRTFGCLNWTVSFSYPEKHICRYCGTAPASLINEPGAYIGLILTADLVSVLVPVLLSVRLI